MVAIENSTIMIGIAYLAIYFVIYKRAKFVGNVMFLLISTILMYHGSTLVVIQDANVTVAIGMILFLGSIISLLYDILYKSSPKMRRY